MSVRVGQVYDNPYNVVFRTGIGTQYQILAIWDQFAWVHVFRRGISMQPKGPETYELSFFEDMKVLYELPDHLT